MKKTIIYSTVCILALVFLTINESLAQPLGPKLHLSNNISIQPQKGASFRELLKYIKHDIGPRLYLSTLQNSGTPQRNSENYVVPSIMLQQPMQKLFNSIGMQSKAIDVIPKADVDAYCKQHGYHRFMVPYSQEGYQNPFSIRFLHRDFSNYINDYQIEYVSASKDSYAFVFTPKNLVYLFKIFSKKSFLEALDDAYMFTNFRDAFLRQYVALLFDSIHKVSGQEIKSTLEAFTEGSARNSWQMLQPSHTVSLLRWAMTYLKTPVDLGSAAICPLSVKTPMKIKFHVRSTQQDVVMTLCNDNTTVIVEDTTSPKPDRKSKYEITKQAAEELKRSFI